MEAVPVASLVWGIAGRDLRLVLAGAVLMPLFAVAPIAYGLDRKWSFLAGVSTAGFGIFVMFLNAVRMGEVDWIVGIVPYVAALYLFQKERKKAAAPAEPAPDASGHWLKENVEAIVVAFIMALVIRCFCIEVFKIPSGSMEPTLLGDYSDRHSKKCPFPKYHASSDGGDRIMVTKYYYLLEDVQRFDVVVFKFPLELPRNFIKRVAQLPNEEMIVSRGNLYVRKVGDPDRRFRIARKTVETQNRIWIRVPPTEDTPPQADLRREVSFLRDREQFLRDWSIEPEKAAIDLHQERLRTPEKETTFRYKNPIDDDSGHAAGDVVLGFDVVASGRVFAKIENESGVFELILEASGSRIDHVRGEVRKSHPLPEAKLSPGKETEVKFMVYDGVAALRLDDRPFPPLEFLNEYDRDLPETRSVLAFGAAGGTSFTRLWVGRDLYHNANKSEANFHDDEIVVTGPGQFLMMGDNVGDSHDSRLWKKYVFRLKSGRVIECEGQQVNPKEVNLAELRKELTLPRIPDYYVKADLNGQEWILYREDLVPSPPENPAVSDAPYVERRHIIGKAFWVWWPMDRWFRMIR